MRYNNLKLNCKTVRAQTKLINQKRLQEVISAPIDRGDIVYSTDVVDLPCNIQKDYVPPMYFGDDLDIQQNVINDFPSLSLSEPKKLDLDASYKGFQKFLETKHQKYLELERLDSLQDKLDRFTNEKCFEEDLVAKNEATLNQISLDLSREDEAIPQNLRIIQDIEYRLKNRRDWE